MTKKEIIKANVEERQRRIFESKFDAAKLRLLIEEKKTAEEILEVMKIKSKQTLKQYLLRLISLDRKFYEIPSMNVRSLQRPVINFKGEVKLTKQMLDFPGSTYAKGDQFEIEADNETVTLRRIVQ